MTTKIAQIVDAAGSLPANIMEVYQIREVPFYYTFDGVKHTQVNSKNGGDEFYLHMKNHTDQVPRTSAPNVHDWIKAFEEALVQGFRKIIVTTISKELSSSYANALLAKKMYLETESPGGDVEIEIITSNSCACGQAALEIHIGRLINEFGWGFEELCRAVKDMIPQVTTLFTVKSLFYMKAGGRIGGATAFLGKIMDIKPVCEFVDGVVRPIKAVRGRKKSLTTMADIVAARLKELKNPVICTQSALADEDESFMIDYLKGKLDINPEVYKSMLGVVVGAHSGPGSIGIGFVGER